MFVLTEIMVQSMAFVVPNIEHDGPSFVKSDSFAFHRVRNDLFDFLDEPMSGTITTKRAQDHVDKKRKADGKPETDQDDASKSRRIVTNQSKLAKTINESLKDESLAVVAPDTFFQRPLEFIDDLCRTIFHPPSRS